MLSLPFHKSLPTFIPGGSGYETGQKFKMASKKVKKVAPTHCANSICTNSGQSKIPKSFKTTEKHLLNKDLKKQAKDLDKADLKTWTLPDLKGAALELKLKASGTKQELIERLQPLNESKVLLTKRLKQVKTSYVFRTSMELTDIPPSTSAWKADPALYPKVDSKTISKYTSVKKEGHKGQSRKGRRMLLSRKIKSVKSFREGNKTFVKAFIIKSFGHEITRPAVILFEKNIPIKGHCTCPIGKCGVCCHIIALLMFLEHYSKTKTTIFALSCTEKLQKWHRKGLRAGIATKASHISLRSFRNTRSTRERRKCNRGRKRNARKERKIDTENIDTNDFFKRDIEMMSQKVKVGLDKEKLHSHFYKTLMKHKMMSTGLSMELHYRNSWRARVVFMDHDYCQNVNNLFDNSILITQGNVHSQVRPESSLPSNENEEELISDLNADKEVPIVQDQKMMYENKREMLDLQKSFNAAETKTGTYEIRLPSYKRVQPCGFNYIAVTQGTNEWHSLRIGVITASKLPSLLGFCGHKQFNEAWFCIHNKVDESTLTPKRFKNFERGVEFEPKAIEHFEEMTGVPVSKSGYFHHPFDRRYGASPDGLAQTFLVEVKTRAQESNKPLQNVTASHIVQCNFQMECTGAQITILESYLPEQKCANFFLIQKDNLLVEVCKTITDSLLESKEIADSWPHEENNYLIKLGQNLKGKKPTFENTKSLRSWINKMAKHIQPVSFVR
ncbi:uncharacterized protein LOC110246766 isoform X1 [Exaiptasia diaphana]|uniref:SWIM-type domain-containing protein n=1 Tax=Exaiptasia diaphana TaxID=2652724 RepID=A0A913XQV6_EXADI|nr:uncharacterized protein LOC110246766 isoform X1 [Exaiptasia diaphana]